MRCFAPCSKKFLPYAILLLHPSGQAGEAVRELIPLVRDKIALGGKATAYVCENFACHAPTNDLEELEEL